jgi:hypothetical protein
MNKHFIFFISLFSSISLSAQIHEVGLFVGGSNYIGDIGATTFIAPNKPAFGALYKWNKSPRHSYRFSYTQSTLAANDAKSKDPSREKRNLQFENNIKEFSAGIEFNFFDFNLHDYKNKTTPYIYSGISYFWQSNLNLDTSSNTIVKDGNKSNIAIPVTLGIKSNISPKFILALEVGAKYTLSDNLDGSNPKKGVQFGNINNNDWYVFSGITLTYTLGLKPCHCAE